MKSFLTLVVVLGSACGNALAQELSPAVRVQIEAAVTEKLARTPVEQKLSSDLLFLSREAGGQKAIPGIPTFDSRLDVDADGRILVDIAAAPSAGLRAAIVDFGGLVFYESPRWQSVRASVPATSLLDLAARADVKRVGKGHQPIAHTGSVTSQGDVAHKADTTRTAFGVDGTGVKVGVISDSADGSANAISLGDLPASFTVLPGRFGSGIGEGTAMSEIVHDLAPGAEIFFATAVGGKAFFADSILMLRAAGCDIIVDDISYSNEWQFQDDEIGQAINTVVGAGAVYLSSSGNEGSLYRNNSTTWEGDFVNAGAGTGPLAGAGRVHSFGAQDYNTLLTDSSNGSLQWSDEYNSSSNDYDLFVLNAAGTAVVSASTNTQNGTQEPFEFVAGVQPGERIVVINFNNAADRYLRLSFTGSPLQIATEGQTIGHAGTQNCICVASSDSQAVFPASFTTSSMSEISSSDGPHKKFYNPNGTPITPGNFLASGGVTIPTPAITAADGGVTTLPPTSGLNPFYGTSAAAPHAAAITALMKSRNPALTNVQLRAALEASCLDIELPGFDVNSGNGILMADLALAAVSPTPVSYGCDTPATGFGAPSIALTAGGSWIGTSFELTVENASTTAFASSIGFELFLPPATSPQSSLMLLGFCWNLPLPFSGAFIPVPGSNVIQPSIPNDPAMNGAEVEWQVFALDPSSTSTGVALTASRGLKTQIAL